MYSLSLEGGVGGCEGGGIFEGKWSGDVGLEAVEGGCNIYKGGTHAWGIPSSVGGEAALPAVSGAQEGLKMPLWTPPAPGLPLNTVSLHPARHWNQIADEVAI